MSSLRIYSAAEQVAQHLREELARGVWTGLMPGAIRLAQDLGVGRMTVDAALELLEQEGVLLTQGTGRRRLIANTISISSSLRVAILPFVIEDYRSDYVMDIQRHLQEEGHAVLLPDKSISNLGSRGNRLANLVAATQADAWIIIAGDSATLSWFIDRGIPAFALFGRRRGLTIPSIGPDKAASFRELVQQLVKLGHQKICLITRPVRRIPVPGAPEKAFLDEMERMGIQTGSNNLPDWDGKAEGLGRILDFLFLSYRPTALVLDEPAVFYSVRSHLANRGMHAPKHLSLVSTDDDPYFEMHRPTVAHITWDSDPWVRRVIKWVRGVSRGKSDTRQSLTKARYVDGGTVGPVPG